MPTTLAADQLDRTFDALANEHRRRIVDRLTAGPIETPTLARTFPLTKQAFHRHVVVLEEAGLVERRLVGRVNQLSLRPQPLDGVTSWASEIRRGWEASADRLARVLEEDPS